VTLKVWLIALTGFGDLAVVGPLAAVILLWLLSIRRSPLALWWAVAVALCIGVTALLKIFFYGCPPTPDLHSPSGHTSLSTLVYGAMALVCAAESGGLQRMAAIAGGASFILAVAASRLLLYAHSVEEVGLGLAIGTACLALFGRAYMRSGAMKVRRSPLFAAAAVVVLILHGRELHAEEFLRGIAQYLRIQCS
jgi:membrane-associated phospholipid phosphatase